MKDEKKYLYEKVYDSLKQDIVAGNIKYNELLPSEKEIGDKLEVDRTTVRKALGMLVDEGLVEKRAGVGTRVIMRQYRPEQRNNYRNIGFLLPRSKNKRNRITQPFYASLFYRVEDECRKKGLSLTYTTLDEEDDFFRVVEAHGLSGVIFVTNVNEKFLKQAVNARIPSIVVNGYYENMASILCNNKEGAYKAISHLAALGHKRIALIKGMEGYVTCDERLEGCYRAAREFGLAFNPEDVYEGNWEFSSGYEGVRKIFSNPKDYPTALFAFNDMMALGAILALVEMGKSVPDDVSIVGFDNDMMALGAVLALDETEKSVLNDVNMAGLDKKHLGALHYLTPQLTTIDVSIKTMATVAVENILYRLDNDNAYAVKIETPVELVTRATTRQLNIVK